MLRWRLLAAASILTPLALLLIADVHWNGGIPGTMGHSARLVIDDGGDRRAARSAGRPRRGGPPTWAVYLGSSLLFLAGGLPVAQGLFGVAVPLSASLELLGCSAATLAGAVMLLFGVEMSRYRDPGRSVAQLALAAFVVVYPGLFMSLLAQLRFVHNNAWGMAALVSLVWVVKFSDTCAYTAGRMFGRHKMSPRLSPGKTIEGAIGALLGAAFASWVYFHFLIPCGVPRSRQLACTRGAASATAWRSAVPAWWAIWPSRWSNGTCNGKTPAAGCLVWEESSTFSIRCCWPPPSPCSAGWRESWDPVMPCTILAIVLDARDV